MPLLASEKNDSGWIDDSTKTRFSYPCRPCRWVPGWWLIPHYDAEDENYYISVLCAVPQQNKQQLQKDMKNVIEGSNSDYALQKIYFVPGLAARVIDNWKSLTQEQQQQAAGST
ncbi:hypothetical protein OLZ33_10210 [Pantoea ananatis]|uniref:hypothetical protein n=1 Tax=Pantoea ananas TaxID=553 RepID=UPI0022230B45|nr:hypothetical protein [Pantoea ananatis]MCW1832365.1 hypothetical protein [Pantoea ananatis]